MLKAKARKRLRMSMGTMLLLGLIVVAFSEKNPKLVEAKFAVEQDEFLSPEMQVKAKYLLSIDGHTAAWTRPVWQLFSNSVMLKQDSPITQ